MLIGPHGSGKTTVGRLVAARLGWRFDPEIGEALRREALRRDPGAHAMRAQDEFDTAVIEAELARDATADRPRVVETWHPGNLAYASRRSPAVAARFRDRVAAAVRAREGAVVQPLRIDEATALARLSQPGPDDIAIVRFFLDVANDAEVVARDFGVPVLPYLSGSDRAPEAMADEIAFRHLRAVS